MKHDPAVPELIIVDERSKRQTLEFCGAEREGLRCMLTRGHDGMHESVARKGRTRWPISSEP